FVHTWDLARAVGLDETVDPGLAAFALSAWPGNALPAGGGGVPFFDEPTVGSASSDLDRLLRLTGREPRCADIRIETRGVPEAPLTQHLFRSGCLLHAAAGSRHR